MHIHDTMMTRRQRLDVVSVLVVKTSRFTTLSDVRFLVPILQGARIVASD